MNHNKELLHFAVDVAIIVKNGLNVNLPSTVNLSRMSSKYCGTFVASPL